MDELDEEPYVVDPVTELVQELATADRPSAAWLARAVYGDPVTSAWEASQAPHSMIRLLAIAQHEDTDAAARAAIRGAADTLRREAPRSDALAALDERRDNSTGAVFHLLFGVWVRALPDIDQRDRLEAEIATRVRAAVRRLPALADLEPSPRHERAPIGRGAIHLRELLVDPSALSPLDPDEVRRASRGRVLSPEGHGRVGPELGGLACERIFGTWRPRSSDLTLDERDEHWGYITIDPPCAHPIVPDARLAVLPVVPPYYRRWQRIEVEELRRYAIERRAQLEAATDLCDPPDKILAEEGLADPDAIDAPGAQEHRLNTIYRAFINYDRRRRRFVELNAPDKIIEGDSAALDATSRKLADAWRDWLAELPADTDVAWALRALAATARNASLGAGARC